MAFEDGVKTVSGSVAHTDDAATKVPFVSVKCGIEPTLSGVSEVTVTQTGRNLLLLTDGTYTIGNTGATATILNGEISVNGTTGNSGGRTTRLSDYFVLHAGTYYISPVIYTSPYVRSYLNKKSDNTVVGYSSGSAFTVSEDTEVYFGINIESGKTYNTTLTPQLEYGSTAHAHEPYTAPTQYTANLGRTIHGGSVDVVKGEGQETYPTIQVGELTFAKVATHTFRCNNFDRVFGNGKYNIYSSQFATYTQGHSTASNIATLEQGNDNTIFLNGGSGTFYISTDSSFDDKTVADFITAYGNTILIYETTTPTDFTFPPITPTPETVGKVNNVYCNTGNTELTYYDNAHGFSEVTVNKTGKNLFNVNQIIGNGYFDMNGVWRPNTSYNAYSFRCNPSMTFTNQGNFAGIVTYWGISGNFLSAINKGSGSVKTFTTPENCCEFRLSIPIANLDGTQMVEIGESASTYEAYSGVSQTAYLHKVIYGGQADVVRGICEPKNLFDDSTFPRTATENNTYYASFQSILAEGNKYKIPTIHIEPDVAYVLSFDVECNTEPFNASVGIGTGYYLKDIASVNNNTSGRISVPFTLTSALKEQYGDILSFRVPRYSSTREFTFTISNVQLEKASSASEYVPHFEPFSFPPISMETDEGENTLFANEGDSAITYRKAVD